MTLRDWERKAVARALRRFADDVAYDGEDVSDIRPDLDDDDQKGHEEFGRELRQLANRVEASG